jgi:hypothetical protein
MRRLIRPKQIAAALPSKRLEALKVKVQAYPFKRIALRLTEAEFDALVGFIEDNDHLGHLEFEYAANRMFLDKPKHKNSMIMQELAVVANSAAYGTARKGFNPKEAQ